MKKTKKTTIRNSLDNSVWLLAMPKYVGCRRCVTLSIDDNCSVHVCDLISEQFVSVKSGLMSTAYETSYFLYTITKTMTDEESTNPVRDMFRGIPMAA